MKTLALSAIIAGALLFTVTPALTQSWTLISAPGIGWMSLATSADGTKQVAIAGNSSVWTSTNSGSAWTSNGLTVNFPYPAIASSADGEKLLIAGASGGGIVPIWTSTNAGSAWLSNSVPTDPSSDAQSSAASSADGERLIVATLGGSGQNAIWTSTNGGLTWRSNTVPISFQDYQCAASSADGRVLLAGNYVGPILVSTNFGLTWKTNNAPAADWQAMASSADGTKLIAAIYNGYIYQSTNSGMTWSTNGSPGGLWRAVAMSADGTTMAAVNFNIYTSTNSGSSWVSNSVARTSRNAVICSADGNMLETANEVGGIYNLISVPSPRLQLTAANGNLSLSWLVPSTNLVLQQSSDLFANNWISLTNLPALNLTNLQEELTLSPTNSDGFFRLISQ